MPRNTRPLRQTQAYEIADRLRYSKYYYESFKGGEQPHFLKTTAGLPALPTAAQGATSRAYTRTGYVEFFETTAQTIFPTGSAGNGLDIACDLVDNEALELVPGGNSAFSRQAFTVGTDPNFFFRAKYLITDVAGSDQAVLCGFRKQAAYAVPTSILSGGDGIYTDFFGVGFADATGTDVFTVSDLNDTGVTVATDTLFNATNAQVLQLEVRVIKRQAIVLINGVRLGDPVAKDGDGTAITSQPTRTTPAFTFDSGDVLVPYVFLRHDTGIANATYLQEWEVGSMGDAGIDPASL